MQLERMLENASKNLRGVEEERVKSAFFEETWGKIDDIDVLRRDCEEQGIVFKAADTKDELVRRLCFNDRLKIFLYWGFKETKDFFRLMEHRLVLKQNEEEAIKQMAEYFTDREEKAAFPALPDRTPLPTFDYLDRLFQNDEVFKEEVTKLFKTKKADKRGKIIIGF